MRALINTALVALLLAPNSLPAQSLVSANEAKAKADNAQQYRYKGFFDVRVIEPDQAQYILGVKFQSAYAAPVNYTLRHYNGKAAIKTFKPFYEQNNGDDIRAINITHKYYVSLRIREDSQTAFSARVKLFKRREDMKLDINRPYHFKEADFRLIEDQPIKGEFNQDNEYLFVDNQELKFYLKLNFDLIFTRQEIIDRFNKSHNR